MKPKLKLINVNPPEYELVYEDENGQEVDVVLTEISTISE